MPLRANWLPPAPLEPWGPYSLAGEEAGGGGANSDGWRESLVLCTLCAKNNCCLQIYSIWNAARPRGVRVSVPERQVELHGQQITPGPPVHARER